MSYIAIINDGLKIDDKVKMNISNIRILLVFFFQYTRFLKHQTNTSIQRLEKTFEPSTKTMLYLTFK